MRYFRNNAVKRTCYYYDKLLLVVVSTFACPVLTPKGFFVLNRNRRVRRSRVLQGERLHNCFRERHADMV